LREIYCLAHDRGLSYLLAGFDTRDPLLKPASAYPHVPYPSRLYLAQWPDGDRMYDQLDGRLAYADIATL
jgi:hypothetical protein